MIKSEKIGSQEAMADIDFAARLVLAVHVNNQWLAFVPKVIGEVDDTLLLDFPPPQPADAATTIVDCSAKLLLRTRSNRYIAAVQVQPAATWQLRGQEVVAMSVRVPPELKRFNRRALPRTDVPSSSGMRGDVWLGDDRELRWAGCIQNISSGGVQIRTSRSILDFLVAGEAVSISIRSALGSEPLMMRGHFRGGTQDGEMAVIGLEFASPEDPAREQIAAIIRQLSPS